MKYALVRTGYSFYGSYKLPKIIEYISGKIVLNFTDGRLENFIVASWLIEETIVLKKTVLDCKFNRALYPEATSLDGYLILDETVKAEDFKKDDK